MFSWEAKLNEVNEFRVEKRFVLSFCKLIMIFLFLIPGVVQHWLNTMPLWPHVLFLSWRNLDVLQHVFSGPVVLLWPVKTSFYLSAALFARLFRPFPCLLGTLELICSPLCQPNCRWLIENFVADSVWLFRAAARGGARQMYITAGGQNWKTQHAVLHTVKSKHSLHFQTGHM